MPSRCILNLINLRLVTSLLVLSLPPLAHAQDLEQKQYPLRPIDNSSPRATLGAFLNLTTQYGEAFGDYQETGEFTAVRKWADLKLRTMSLLDLSEVAPTSRDEVSGDSMVYLWDILSRIELPPLEEVPDSQQMAEIIDDGMPANWTIPDTEITISRMSEGPEEGQYRFSAATLARLVEFHDRVRALPHRLPMPVNDAPEAFQVWGGPLIPPPVTNRFPSFLKQTFQGQALWKWIALALLFIGFVPLVFFVTRWARITPGRTPLQAFVRRLVAPVLILLLSPLASHLLNRQINITGSAAITLVQICLPAIKYLAWAWLAWLVALTIAELAIASPRIHEASVDAHLLRLLARVIGVAAVLLILFYGGIQLGLSLYGLVAGLGVGGLAVALAAQNTLENFIGSINLFTDRPIRVGDFCLYGDDVGTIEEIGVRSTRIRGIDRTVSTIPNADFSRMKITNLTRRDRMLLKTTIGLRYETTPDQIRYVLAKMRELLLAHPRVSDEPARVRFAGFGASSLDLDVFAYVMTSDFNEFLAIQEDILLRFIHIVDEAGTGFAFPSQTLYMARDGGLDEARRERAESIVESWRDSAELPFPAFGSEFATKIRDTLDYPPSGSPSNKPYRKRTRRTLSPDTQPSMTGPLSKTDEDD